MSESEVRDRIVLRKQYYDIFCQSVGKMNLMKEHIQDLTKVCREMRINFKKNGEMWIPDEGKFLDCMFMTIPPNHTPLSTEIEKIEACDKQLTKPSSTQAFKKPDIPKDKSDIKLKAITANKNNVKNIKRDKTKEINKFKVTVDKKPKSGKCDPEKFIGPIFEKSDPKSKTVCKNTVEKVVENFIASNPGEKKDENSSEIQISGNISSTDEPSISLQNTLHNNNPPDSDGKIRIDLKEIKQKNISLVSEIASENSKIKFAPMFTRKRTNPDPVYGTKNKVQRTDEYENISSPEVEIVDEVIPFIPEKLVKLNPESEVQNLPLNAASDKENSDMQEKNTIDEYKLHSFPNNSELSDNHKNLPLEHRNIDFEIMAELNEIELENPELIEPDSYYTEENQNEEQQNAVNEILEVTFSNENENNPDILKTTIEKIGGINIVDDSNNIQNSADSAIKEITGEKETDDESDGNQDSSGEITDQTTKLTQSEESNSDHQLSKFEEFEERPPKQKKFMKKKENSKNLGLKLSPEKVAQIKTALKSFRSGKRGDTSHLNVLDNIFG